MLSTTTLLGACFGLFLLWLGLSLWILADRALHDLQARVERDDAAELLAPRRGRSRPPMSTRRLRRVASRTPGATAALAARRLVELDEQDLVRSAQHGRSDIGRARALRILARGGSGTALDLLRTTILEAEPRLAATAVAIAAELETPAADALLLDVLSAGEQPRSRTATQLEPRVHGLRDELLALAAVDEPGLRYWAMTLLGRLGRDRAVGRLTVRLASDPDANVRAAAAEALGNVSPGRRTLPLQRLLRDEVFYVRAHAARAVGAGGAAVLARDVAALLADTNWWVRAAAKESLLALGAAGLEAAIEMLTHHDAFARDSALEVVAAPGRAQELLAAARAGDADAAAAVRIVASRIPGFLPELLRPLAEPQPETAAETETQVPAPLSAVA